MCVCVATCAYCTRLVQTRADKQPRDSRQTRGGVSQQANRQHKNTRHRLGQSLLCHLRHRKSTALAETRSHETFSSRPPRTVQSSSPARFLQGKSPLTTLGLE